MSGNSVTSVRPFHYVHVKDLNTNIVKLVSGPTNLTCKIHEKIIFGPEKMVIVPPRHYVIVDNPVSKSTVLDKKTGNRVEVPILDEHGQAQLRHGAKEIRFTQQPFPLYDGEKCSPLKQLTVVEDNTALKLRALTNFKDKKEKERKAGDMWLFYGHNTYTPQIEVEVVETVKAVVLKQNQALKIRAKEVCKDYLGTARVAGEEWLVRKEGPYIPNVREEVVEVISGIILDNKTALHVRAKTNFQSQGITRKAGTQWLITNEDTSMYFPDVHEEIVNQQKRIILKDNEYCVLKNYVDEELGTNKRGFYKIIRGPASFFLKPGESISSNGKSVILSSAEALVLRATEDYNGRKVGETWWVYGPAEFWPPVEVQISSRKSAFLVIEPLNLYLFRPTLFFLAWLLLRKL